MQDDAKLKIENIYMRFGGLVALDNVSLQVKRGEILIVYPLFRLFFR